MAIEIWKHFTSDSEEFQAADVNAPAWFGAEFTAPGVKSESIVYTNWSERDKVIVFFADAYGIFHLAELAILSGVRLHRLPSHLGSRQAILQHYEISP